jgi:hypothetical protein
VKKVEKQAACSSFCFVADHDDVPGNSRESVVGLDVI